MFALIDQLKDQLNRKDLISEMEKDMQQKSNLPALINLLTQENIPFTSIKIHEISIQEMLRVQRNLDQLEDR